MGGPPPYPPIPPRHPTSTRPISSPFFYFKEKSFGIVAIPYHIVRSLRPFSLSHLPNLTRTLPANLLPPLLRPTTSTTTRNLSLRALTQRTTQLSSPSTDLPVSPTSSLRILHFSARPHSSTAVPLHPSRTATSPRAPHIQRRADIYI